MATEQPSASPSAAPLARDIVLRAEELHRALSEIHMAFAPHSEGLDLNPALAAANQLLRLQKQGQVSRWANEANAKLTYARGLIADDKSGDPRALKQSLKILQDVSVEGKQQRGLSAKALVDSLPAEVLHQVTVTSKEIGSSLERVWARYCVTDLPALLASLSVSWSNPGNGGALPNLKFSLGCFQNARAIDQALDAFGAPPQRLVDALVDRLCAALSVFINGAFKSSVLDADFWTAVVIPENSIDALREAVQTANAFTALLLSETDLLRSAADRGELLGKHCAPDLTRHAMRLCSTLLAACEPLWVSALDACKDLGSEKLSSARQLSSVLPFLLRFLTGAFGPLYFVGVVLVSQVRQSVESSQTLTALCTLAASRLGKPDAFGAYAREQVWQRNSAEEVVASLLAVTSMLAFLLLSTSTAQTAVALAGVVAKSVDAGAQRAFSDARGVVAGCSPILRALLGEILSAAEPKAVAAPVRALPV